MLDEERTIGEDRSIGELLAQLADDSRALVRAEIALYRAEAARRALSAGWAAGLIVAAVTLAQGALIALLVGLILVAQSSFGIGLSVAIIVGGALVLAVLLGWLAWRNIARMVDPDRP